MTTEIVIAGAGGFAKEVLWLVQEINQQSRMALTVRCCISPEGAGTIETGMGSWPVAGDDEWAAGHLPAGIGFVVAVGDPALRRKIASFYEAAGFKAVTLIHPGVNLSSAVKVGEGSILYPHSLATTDIVIGRHAVVNLGCTLSHDVVVEDYAVISPGCHLTGNSKVGAGAVLGAGVVLLPGVKVGAGAIVGAGAVVTRDVADGKVVAGVPAKELGEF